MENTQEQQAELKARIHRLERELDTTRLLYALGTLRLSDLCNVTAIANIIFREDEYGQTHVKPNNSEHDGVIQN